LGEAPEEPIDSFGSGETMSRWVDGIKVTLNSLYTTDFQKREREARVYLKKLSEDYDIYFSNKLHKAIAQGEFAAERVDSSSLTQPFFAFEKREYRLVTFDGLTLGKERAASPDDLSLVSDVTFYYCTFADCVFSNIQFQNCTFVGCVFQECYSNNLGVVFERCAFRSLFSGKKSIDDMHASFNGCEMTVAFNNCDLTMAVFNKTNLYFSQIRGCNLSGAVLCDGGFDTMAMSDCDLRGTKMIGMKLIDFTLQDVQSRSRVDRNSFVGELNFDRASSREVKFAVEAYCGFNELFESNSVSSLSGEYFYLFKKTDLLQLKRTSKIFSYFGLLSCGYGERPFFSLLLSALIVIACGFLYLIFGVSLGSDVLIYRPTLNHLLPDLGQTILCMHFSLVTFSTVGYGNVVPIGGSILVSAAEIILGIINVGIFVSTLVRKMSR
jgi:uncharacterized protein YjbI with pentapeptide repeats